jgi:hypothetical protein
LVKFSTSFARHPFSGPEVASVNWSTTERGEKHA